MEEISAREQELRKKAVRGDLHSFGQLIELHKAYLYRIAFLYTKNEALALDAVGSCMMKGFDAIRTLRKPEHFLTWLTRIQINCALDECRRREREMPVEEIPEVPVKEEGISREEKMDLYDAVDRLPEKQKTVVILKYFCGMTMREIADMMDCSEKTVKTYLYRARGGLREVLREDMYDELA